VALYCLRVGFLTRAGVDTAVRGLTTDLVRAQLSEKSKQLQNDSSVPWYDLGGSRRDRKRGAHILPDPN
jgi:hypothetical protein